MSAEKLRDRYTRIRAATEALAAPLAPEDTVVQTMVDVSPTKWHLAHTTWFFETFVLRPHAPGYEPVDPAYEMLFNSYYNSVGEQFPRARRGLLSRPTLAEVRRYRSRVDEAIQELLAGDLPPAAEEILTLGLAHEQQHQELLLTDVKHVLSVNPLAPAYRDDLVTAPRRAPPEMEFRAFDGGLFEIGHEGRGFAFDNERPRHERLVRPFLLASRPVTNAEFLGFVEDGGYERPELWLSDGWGAVQEEGWRAPLYWDLEEGATFTLGGRRELHPDEPVCHVSFYEAEAYARWAGARLPLEEELEIALGETPRQGNFAETGALHPLPAEDHVAPGSGAGLLQLWGEVWEWTSSPYLGYPGYRPHEGAVGEYNGKFMANQWVLRGGSCATSRDHLRATYRNFFHSPARWQFTGLRLARDAT